MYFLNEQVSKEWLMRLKKHWKRLKHLRRSFICFIIMDFSTKLLHFLYYCIFAYYFKFQIVESMCNWCVCMLSLLISSFYLCNGSNNLIFLSQLPARQEPVLDSSKYTAVDVRIVSRFSMTCCNYLYN